MSFVRSTFVGSVFGTAIISSVLALFSNPFKNESLSDNKSLDNHSSWNHNWDCENNVSPPLSSRNHIRKLIILVRHGQYEVKASSPDGRVLTQLGWKQAVATGKRLREVGYE